MTRSRLLLALAATFAGLAVVLAVLGVVYSLVLLAAAVPFAGTAYLLWYHASGRLVARARRRAGHDPTSGRRARDRFRRRAAERLGGDPRRERRERRDRVSGGTAGPRGNAGRAPRGGGASPTRTEAADVLGVPIDADDDQIRAAYRDRAKDLHPDAEGGSEEAFKRITAAYERLSER